MDNKSEYSITEYNYLLNAYDLLISSKKVNARIGTSLLILALEEISIGYWLLFCSLLLTEPLCINLIKTRKEEINIKEVKKNISKNIAELSNKFNLPKNFSGALKGFFDQGININYSNIKNHKSKHNLIYSLFNLLELIFKSKENFFNNINIIHDQSNKSDSSFLEYILKLILDIINNNVVENNFIKEFTLDKQEINEFDDLKNAGFYTNIDKKFDNQQFCEIMEKWYLKTWILLICLFILLLLKPIFLQFKEYI